MKKIITLLFLLGMVGTVSADTVKKRIYVVVDDNCHGKIDGHLGIHIWYYDGADNPKYSWDTSDEQMGDLAEAHRVYCYDVDLDSDKEYYFKLYKYTGSRDSHEWESSAGQTISSEIISYYNYTTNNGNIISEGSKVSYKAYIYNSTTSTWSSSEAMTPNSTNDEYTLTINNQSSTNSLQVLIAPSFALDSYGSSDERWAMMYRPAETLAALMSSNYNNLTGGCYGANHYSLRGSNYIGLAEPLYYKLTYKPFDWTYSIDPYFTRTLPSAAEGYATFSHEDYDVIPEEGLGAYYASAVSKAGFITWNAFPSTGIYAGDAALLVGTAGKTYKFTPAPDAEALASNLLKPINSTKAAKVLDQTEDGNINFILSKKNDHVAFYKVNASGSWVNEGTAYLQVPGSVGAREFFAFDDEMTSIDAVNQDVVFDGEYFNLAGQRIVQPKKGLYILNGKKVIK